MSYRARLSVLLASTVIGAVGAISNVSAQDAETVSDQSTGFTFLDLLVVGAGQEKVAIDTPQAVTVLDQEAIDDAQASTISELFNQVPGVNNAGGERLTGQSFNIRGIGTGAASDESKIIVTVDGAVKFHEQYRVGSFFSDPELYKSVEVLRGPASSTLYGSGAFGGVVNFTTKDPDDFIREGQTAAIRLKSQYETNIGGVMTSVIGAYAFSDQTSLLLNGNYRQSQNAIGGSGNTIGGTEAASLSGLAKLVHKFGDANEQVFKASYQQWQSNADDTKYDQVSSSFATGTVDRDVIDQTLVFSYENPASDNPFLDLKANLSYSNTKVEQSDATGSGSQLYEDGEHAYRTWSAKLENTFEAEGDLFQNFLTVGTQLSHQTRVAETTSGAIGYHPEGTDAKLGLFVQDELIVADKLTFIPGVRFDFARLDPDGSISGASTQNDVSISPKIAAMFELNDTFSVFGSIAHTERMPTLDELFSTSARAGAVKTPSLGLKKEKSNNYEIGFSADVNDLVSEGDSFKVKTTGFYNDLKDLIETNSGNNVSYYKNVGEARILGFEVEGAYEAEYAFASFAFSRLFGENMVDKKKLNSVPAMMLDLTLGARLPDRNISFGWNGQFAGTKRTDVTDRFGNPVGETYAGYSVHNLFASWKPDEGHLQGWELRASAGNIFDKKYRSSFSGDEGKGRNFKLTVSKELGW